MQTIPSLHLQFLEATGTGICWVDATGTITFANSRVAEMLGCTVDTLTGCPLDGAVQDAVPIHALLAHAARGLPFHCESVAPRAAGKAHLLSLAAHPILDQQGNPTSTLVSFARYDAAPGIQSASAASEAQFRALFESFDEGVATIEIQFDESGQAIDYCFLAVNRAHLAIVGMGTEVVGKYISEVMPNIDPSVIQRMGRVALTGEPIRFEDYILPLDHWFDIYLFRVGHEGSRTVVSVFKNITERKRRERLQAFLLILSDALRPHVDPQEIQTLAADLLGEHLQVNIANYGEVRGGHVHISHSYANGLAPMVGVFLADDFGKRLIDGHRAGKLQVCVDTTSDPLFEVKEREALAAAHIGAYIAVPLVKKGVWVGVLSVLNIEPRDWAPTEVEAVQEVAERTWAAVERSRAEKALIGSEEKYRSLFESIDEGVSTLEVLFDERDNVTDYIFLEINAAHEAISGVKRDVIGKRISEVMPNIESFVLQKIGKVVLTGEPVRFEQYIRSLDSWFEIYLSRVGHQGSRTVVSVFKNITERKRRERLQAFLLTLSDALRPLVDPQEIQVLAADLLGHHLQVNHVHYGEVSGEYVHISHSFADGLAPMVGAFHAENFGKRMIDGHRAGRVQICVNTTTDPLFEEPERKVLAAAHVGAYIAVPLVKEGVWVGVLSVENIQPRNWVSTEVEAVQEVAERTWAAVERTRAERALIKSEERYRSLFESIDEGVCTVEVLFDEHEKAVDYRFLEINSAHEAMSGIGRDVIGKRGCEVIPALEESVIERLGQVALTGQPIRVQEFVSGLGRWFDIYLARDGSDGRRVISVFTNITERKRREANLRFLAETSMDFAPSMGAAEIMHGIGERLAQYLNLARCSFGVVDMDADEIDCVYAWRRDDVMADLMGKHRISAFLNESGRQHYAAGQLSVIDDTQTNTLLNPLACGMLDQLGVCSIVDVPCIKDGRWSFLLTVARSTTGPWHEDEIELIRQLAERTYIRVERARAEAALLDSEERLKALIENLPGGAVFVVDTQLRYLIAEGEAIAQAGLKSVDFLGKSIREALPENLATEYESYYSKALAGEHFEHEHEAHEHVYLTRGLPLRSSSGEIYAVLAASFDITARKRAEAESRDVDRRKDEFLAMLAHELRNPLAAISSATQVMRHLSVDNASVQRPREVIERQLQHLTRLVDDLLDMSRLTWGKINLRHETLSLATVLNSAVEATRPLIDARGHRLTIMLPPSAVHVAGDATRLVQVFGNLLNNAAKYTEPGGHIELRTTIESEEAIVCVSDNGCGLSASLLPHVFELFTQAGRSLDRSQGGLGLGLALVFSLVKMHGGTVEARSAGLGKGSEFVVRLPLTERGNSIKHPAPKIAAAQSAAIAPRMNVLVVEDNADAAEMLVLLLRHGGDEVRLAQNGLAALDQMREFQSQVVLCDIGLPGLSGYEVATHLRRQPQYRDTMLVALSGYGRDEDRRQSQLAGFDHHLTKPVDLEVLAALLELRRLVAVG